MACFLSAYPDIFSNEIGYVSNPKDKGGETINGITRKNYPNWEGWAIVDAHKPLSHGDTIPELDSLTKQFYKRTQWDALHLDALDSQDIARFMCDWYVNSGALAVKHLQRILSLKDDGIVGMQTINAVNAADERVLLSALKQDRIAFYQHIVATDPTQKEFLKGWLARTERLA